MILPAKNYQNQSMCHEVIANTKVAQFFLKAVHST